MILMFKNKLFQYKKNSVEKIIQVKIIRAKERTGLIRARMMGAAKATAPGNFVEIYNQDNKQDLETTGRLIDCLICY